CPNTAAAMLRVHIDLLEMCHLWFEHLDVREAHRRVVSQGDPEMAIALGLLQDVMAGRLAQNGRRCVPDQQLRSGELNRRERPDIALAGRRDDVPRGHVFSGNRKPDRVNRATVLDPLVTIAMSAPSSCLMPRALLAGSS